jgi:hypothetical protein
LLQQLHEYMLYSRYAVNGRVGLITSVGVNIDLSFPLAFVVATTTTFSGEIREIDGRMHGSSLSSAMMVFFWKDPT